MRCIAYQTSQIINYSDFETHNMKQKAYLRQLLIKLEEMLGKVTHLGNQQHATDQKSRQNVVVICVGPQPHLHLHPGCNKPFLLSVSFQLTGTRRFTLPQSKLKILVPETFSCNHSGQILTWIWHEVMIASW